MLLFSRTLTREHICFQSESSISAALFDDLFRCVFHCELTVRENIRRNDLVLYCYDITDTDLIDRVFTKYRFGENERKVDSEIIATNSLGVFTAGVFLACGSVNDPSKEYHLEFSAPTSELAGDLTVLLGDIGVSAGQVIRRGQYIVYIKGSESIEDTLTFIGAQQCTLELMNVKIYKDVRNKANRIRNCDAANIDKVLNAAMKQRQDIMLIASAMGLESLSDELREVAELRLENNDMSLQEIGESLSVPISRSGVNHRFKKLAKIADELRSGGKGHEK
jgi:DNA-binding protein WhiA